MDEKINYKCEYLDQESGRCVYLDEMGKMPKLTPECRCLECLVALYRDTK